MKACHLLSFFIMIICLYTPTFFGMQKYKKIITQNYIKPYKLYFQKPEYKITDSIVRTGNIEPIINWMDEIENKNQSFRNYDGRTGISWDDITIFNPTHNSYLNPRYMRINRDYPIATEDNGEILYPKAQSFLSDAEVSRVVFTNIIPKFLRELESWTPIPKELRLRMELHRYRMNHEMNGQDNSINFHQDPGTLYKRKSNYTMALLLSDPHGHFGWHGGEFILKEGKPMDVPLVHAKLIPKYNCAILFNNRRYSHAVTSIIAKSDRANRDILILEAYTENDGPQELLL